MSELETIAFRWQFCGGDDEESSAEVRAWEGAHGDLCLAVANRTPATGVAATRCLHQDRAVHLGDVLDGRPRRIEQRLHVDAVRRPRVAAAELLLTGGCD